MQQGGNGRPAGRHTAHQIMFAVDLHVAGQVGQAAGQLPGNRRPDQHVAAPLEDEHGRGHPLAHFIRDLSGAAHLAERACREFQPAHGALHAGVGEIGIGQEMLKLVAQSRVGEVGADEGAHPGQNAFGHRIEPVEPRVDAPERGKEHHAVDAMGDAAGDAVDAMGDAADAVGDKMEGGYDAATDSAMDAGEAMRGGAVAAAGLVERDVVEAGDILAADAVELDAADLAAEPTADELRAELERYIQSLGSTSSEFRREIEYVEGIGAAYGQALRGVGINTVLDLLVNGATRRGRKHLSDQSGISQSNILTWVNHIDLFRIKGVAQEYADLLEQSGVDTVVELAQRNPTNLHKRMLDINAQKSLVRRAPHASEVQSWVEQARNLRRLIYY